MANITDQMTPENVNTYRFMTSSRKTTKCANCTRGPMTFRFAPEGRFKVGSWVRVVLAPSPSTTRTVCPHCAQTLLALPPSRWVAPHDDYRLIR